MCVCVCVRARVCVCVLIHTHICISIYIDTHDSHFLKEILDFFSAANNQFIFSELDFHETFFIFRMLATSASMNIFSGHLDLAIIVVCKK